MDMKGLEGGAHAHPVFGHGRPGGPVEIWRARSWPRSVSATCHRSGPGPPGAGGAQGAMVQVPTSMRPERAALFLVVLWVTKSRRVSVCIEWVQTAPGSELTIVKNPPL